MESRVKVLGHPAHQMLVPLPIGLLIGSVGMDFWGWSIDDPSWTVAAHRLMGIGVLAGMTAAPTALALFAGSWYLRRQAPEAPSLAARLLSLAAVSVLSLATWFGGEMVARLGVGVSPRAHLNAPRSLRVRRSARAVRVG